METSTRPCPAHVTQLEAAYGGPSQAGFGSAVFCRRLGVAEDLTQAALAIYRTFVGGLWERYGEHAWMGPWKEVYARQPSVAVDLVAELRGIADPAAHMSVPTILDAVDGPEAARAALAAAFDDPAVRELRVFNLGDGQAMSGLLVAGRRGAEGGAEGGASTEATFLVFLLD